MNIGSFICDHLSDQTIIKEVICRGNKCTMDKGIIENNDNNFVQNINWKVNRPNM